ncbi:MAG: Fe-S cluster assembly protein SufB, partial [Candidatus Buchananbacteria bacterium CG10_big_fil_rev_8_21_14_0_10_42_9]
SKDKDEPKWMLDLRLRALTEFEQKPMPTWGPSLDKLDLNSIRYYGKATDETEKTTWSEVPQDIKDTFDKLGIPEAEREYLGGVGAQYESAMVYHSLKQDLSDQSVIFENMDTALKQYPNIVKKYFMTKCVPISDHKFAALHGAVWSGGTFIYVPKGVKVELPLQAYFRMNSELMGQFEHTLIIADEGSQVHYIEGCSAPQYTKNSLHAGCVEIYVGKHARVRYSSIENWSKNTFNLNTKRAVVDESGLIEWVNGNMGSGVTMLYPSSILKGRKARSDSVGIAFAGSGQHQDTGSKVIHLAPDTASTIRNKSISKDNGICTYRGLVRIVDGATNAKSSVVCDALLVNDNSVSNTIPNMEIREKKSDMVHEAVVGKISQAQIFYLMSRGLSEDDAKKMIVSGFIDPITRALPGEYSVELNRLIELEMEGAIG